MPHKSGKLRPASCRQGHLQANNPDASTTSALSARGDGTAWHRMNQQSPTLLSCWRTVTHSLASTACRFLLSQCSTHHRFMHLSPCCCILCLQSVYHVCWMRGLFPEGSFTGHDLAQLDSESPSRHPAQACRQFRRALCVSCTIRISPGTLLHGCALHWLHLQQGACRKLRPACACSCAARLGPMPVTRWGCCRSCRPWPGSAPACMSNTVRC